MTDPLSIRFFGNAFLEIRLRDGRRIVCDPWIENGAYYGSWWHFPPFRVPADFFRDVDYLYISHLHPDHCHPPSLKHFDPTTPVILSKRKTPVVDRILKGLGFANQIVLSTDTDHEVDGFRVKLWNDFGGGDVARQDDVGFDLDSSIAVMDGNDVVLNINDNVVEPAAALEIARDFPQIRCALLPYAGAGPFPQLFDNLTHEQKVIARDQVQERFLSNFFEVARVLDADVTVPVAGEYVLVGRLHELTQYLHTPDPDTIASGWSARGLGEGLVQLGPGDVLDLDTLQLDRANAGSPSHVHADRVAYARSQADAELDIDDFVVPPDLRLPRGKLLALLTKARQHMYAQQEKDGLFPATTLLLDVTGTGSFATPLFECSGWSVPSDPLDEPWIRVTIDYPVLIALLTTHVSWNNLEIGCHLRFHRQPDVYDPSVHTLLSFLHL